jgi:hypothetical protein
MTPAEIEILAIAIYESIARQFEARDGLIMPSWLDAPIETREDSRKAAQQMHAEATGQ